MRRYFFAAAVALAPLTMAAGCSPGPDPQSTPAAGFAETITIAGTKGLVIAELAYNTANPAAQAAVRAGLVKGDSAARMRELNRRILAALATAKATQSAAVQASEVGKAIDAIAELKNLTPANFPANEQVNP